MSGGTKRVSSRVTATQRDRDRHLDPLGAATGLMIWMWMSTVRRGAAMTDTVGEAK